MKLEAVSPESLLGKEIKQEADDFSKNIKEEPLDNKYFEQIVPKREEFIELSSDATQKSTQKQELISELDFKPSNLAPTGHRMPTLNKNSISKQKLAEINVNSGTENNKKYMKRKLVRNVVRENQTHLFCSLCSKMEKREQVKWLPSKEEELIIMVGCVLNGDCTVEKARKLMSENRYKQSVYICYNHFFDAFDKICNVLHITNTDDIFSCSWNLSARLMPIVIALSYFGRYRFGNILRNFVKRYGYLLRKTFMPPVLKSEEQKPNGIHTSERMPSAEHVPVVEREEQKSKNYIIEKEIKQETENYFKEVKEEIMDQEYFNDIVPKLEEVIEPTSSNILNQTMHPKKHVQQYVSGTFSRKTQNLGFFLKKETSKNFRYSLPEPQNSTFGLNLYFDKTHNCSVCLKWPGQHAKSTPTEHDKMVIMVGFLLCGRYTLENAQQFLSNDTDQLSICDIHFSEAINEIYKALNITNHDEITTCSIPLLRKVITIVRSLYPLFDGYLFPRVLLNFALNNMQRINSSMAQST